MRLARILWALSLLMPLLFFETVLANPTDTDDETPELTARVARISFLRGEAQIKRAGSDDWERATLNLPLVEGDQIVTENGARVEIQFDRDSFLRIAENSYLQIKTLRDEGVAVSLPHGTLSLRVLSFDKNRTYFEIDAPQTTLAVQKTGMYRVDAGEKDSTEVRVTATDGGEARVYSENSGFALRDGRSARIYLAGNYAGEWETADAARFADEWDAWVLDRDARIAKLLRDAHYDKYYDRDIYGAEDLNDHGEWVYTRKYGWVWKPYRDSIASYADWSPYRYGHWRWVPPFGWTWINDEPWGWATYHHGRWVYVDRGWVWSPYGHRRPRRSWWRPALVVVTWSGNLICWYPLPFHYGYYNYNRHYSKYIDRRRYNTTIINNTTVGVNPTPTPSPTPGQNISTIAKPPRDLPIKDIPPSGVVAISRDQFGIKVRADSQQTAPANIARDVLAKEPPVEAPPILPVGIDKSVVAKSEVFVKQPPRRINSDAPIKTGVVDRRAGVALDEEIRRTRVFRDRQPIVRSTDSAAGGEKPIRGQVDGGGGGGAEVRNTGAIERTPRPVIKRNSDETNTDAKPPRESSTTRSTGARPENNGDESVRQPTRPPRNSSDDRTEKPRRNDNPPPVYVPPPPPPPREDQRERPSRPPVRNEPPPSSSSPRNDSSKPPREQPKPDAPQQQRRNEDSKPKPPADAESGKPGKID
jgi:hypothetical protein